MVDILNLNIKKKSRACKRTSGQDFTLVDCMLESIDSPRGSLMYRINYLLVGLICSIME